jgi:hypothetical protein
MSPRLFLCRGVEMTQTRKTRLITVTGAVLLAISPVTISSDGRIVPAQACADGTCCPEAKSICFINGIRTNDAF